MSINPTNRRNSLISYRFITNFKSFNENPFWGQIIEREDLRFFYLISCFAANTGGHLCFHFFSGSNLKWNIFRFQLLCHKSPQTLVSNTFVFINAFSHSTCPRVCWSSRSGSTCRSSGGRSGSPWRRRRRTRQPDTHASAGGFYRSRPPGDKNRVLFRKQFDSLNVDKLNADQSYLVVFQHSEFDLLSLVLVLLGGGVGLLLPLLGASTKPQHQVKSRLLKMETKWVQVRSVEKSFQDPQTEDWHYHTT